MSENIIKSLSDNELLLSKLRDAQTPGSEVEFDPEEAEQAGFFIETAMSEEDAIEGVFIADTMED